MATGNPRTVFFNVVFILMLMFAASARSAERYVFLGDSLVDNQNSYIATTILTPDLVIPASPPYYDGRFSNGPNWTDQLASDQLFYMDYYFSASDGSTASPGAQPGVSLNFAFGGSRTGDDVLPDAAPGLLTVLDDLAAYNASGEVADLKGATFAILTGGNDYTYYVATGGDGLSEQEVVDQTLGYLSEGLNRVAEMEPGRVIVINLFDLDRVPSLASAFTSSELAQSGRLSDLHNAGLPGILAAARASTGMEIILVDLHAMYDDIFSRPEIYGFNNTTGSCITSDADHTDTGECPDGECEDATLFWDGQHPTTAAHAYIAQLVTATVGAVTEDGGRLAALGSSSMLQLRRVNTAIRSRLASLWEDNGTMRDSNRTFFLVSERGFGNQERMDEFTAYDYHFTNVITGFAYDPERFDKDLRLGAHLGLLSLGADMDGGGSFDNKGVGLGVFAHLRRGDFVFGAQTSLVRLRLDDIDRPTRFSVMPTAHGDTKGWGLTTEVESAFTRQNSWHGYTTGFTLSGHLSASRTAVDGYEEQDVEFLDLTVDSYAFKEVRAGIGIASWMEFPTRIGQVNTHLSLDYECGLLNDHREIDAWLPSGQSVYAESQGPSENLFGLSGGVSLLNKNGLTVTLVLATAFDSDFDQRLLVPQFTVTKRF